MPNNSMGDINSAVDSAIDGPQQDNNSTPDPKQVVAEVVQLLQAGMSPQQFMQMVQQAMQGGGQQQPPQQSSGPSDDEDQDA